MAVIHQRIVINVAIDFTEVVRDYIMTKQCVFEAFKKKEKHGKKMLKFLMVFASLMKLKMLNNYFYWKHVPRKYLRKKLLPSVLFEVTMKTNSTISRLL